jgi:hypothetical protein
MDIGAILGSPTRDPEWLKKCALTGLMVLIPIAGVLNLMGWMKAAYLRAKAGDATLPDAGLGYIGDGWTMFLAVLPPFLILLGLNIVGAVLTALDLRALAALFNLLGLLLNLALSLVVTPALVYRHLVHGAGFADGFDVAAVTKVITGNTSAFLTFALVYFVASLVGGLGAIACGLGLILSAPFAAAIVAADVDAFERTAGL